MDKQQFECFTLSPLDGRYAGFWKPMDTLRDNQELNKLWTEEKAPWKVW